MSNTDDSRKKTSRHARGDMRSVAEVTPVTTSSASHSGRVCVDDGDAKPAPPKAPNSSHEEDDVPILAPALSTNTSTPENARRIYPGAHAAPGQSPGNEQRIFPRACPVPCQSLDQEESTTWPSQESVLSSPGDRTAATLRVEVHVVDNDDRTFLVDEIRHLREQMNDMVAWESAACTPAGQVNMSPQESSPVDASGAQEQASQSIPFSSQGLDQPSEDIFWNHCDQIIALVLVLVTTGVAVPIIVVVTKPESDSAAGCAAGFDYRWSSDEGVVIGPGHQSHSISTLELCAQNCAILAATAGFFKPSEGGDPPLCYCEFGSKCLDASLAVTGAKVFSKFPKPGPCASLFCQDFPDDPVCDSTSSPTPEPTTLPPTAPATEPTSPPTPIQTMPSTPASTPSPPTPSPTMASSRTPAPTAPPGTILSSVYQVNWGGFVYPEGGCEEPTPGIRVFCAEGAEIEILDNTETVDCSYAGIVEVSCNVTFEENYVWALVYACTGSSLVSWTTNVEVTPGASVECSSGGMAGNAIILMQRCPFQEEPVLDNMQCNPAESAETNQQGDKICLTYSEFLLAHAYLALLRWGAVFLRAPFLILAYGGSNP